MKILIVNLMQIGDLILTTPVFHSLRDRLPDAFIAAAVNKSFAELVNHNPFINQIFSIDKHSFKLFLDNLRAIRAHHFDLVINLNRSERASALAAFSGGKSILGYSKPGFSLLFNKVLPNLKKSMHQVYSHFKVLDYAGFNNLNIFGLEIFIPDDVQRDISIFWAQHFQPSDRVVAFNIGASWTTKRWLPEYFAKVAEELIERGFHVAFVGSKPELPLVNLCVSYIKPSERLHIFTGQFSLLQLAAFFDNCSLLVTNDSGPLHIAVARNLPSVSIYGSSPTIGFSPFADNHFLIKSPAPCHPCYSHSCLNSPDSSNHFTCMKSILPETVLSFSLKLLSKFNQPAKNIPRTPNAYECKIIDLAK